MIVISSKTCGGGERSRGRDCVLPSYQRGSNELGCLGDADQREACEEESCPVWTEWSEWTECPVTCGGGVQVCEQSCRSGEILTKGISWVEKVPGTEKSINCQGTLNLFRCELANVLSPRSE